MVNTKYKIIIEKNDSNVSDSTLYDNFHPKKSLKGTGFKNAKVALDTIKLHRLKRKMRQNKKNSYYKFFI